MRVVAATAPRWKAEHGKPEVEDPPIEDPEPPGRELEVGAGDDD
jgi:hypothetical protein